MKFGIIECDQQLYNFNPAQCKKRKDVYINIQGSETGKYYHFIIRT